jgi:hypothetical protein
LQKNKKSVFDLSKANQRDLITLSRLLSKLNVFLQFNGQKLSIKKAKRVSRKKRANPAS